MKEYSGNAPVIVAARRSAIGRAGGIFRDYRIEQLAAPVLACALADCDIPHATVDDVLLGNVFGPGGNPARVSALAAGLGVPTPASTIDRQCASGLEAVHLAATMIAAGRGSLYLAGGVESPSTAPWRAHRPREPVQPPQFYSRAAFAPAEFGDPDMGEAADLVAAKAGITREHQDRFAAASHRKAMEAIRNGIFDAEIVPIGGNTTDERPREGLSATRLARLRPAFTKSGCATAGNSCGVNDGAAVVAMVPAAFARSIGLPGIRIVDWQATGVDPARPGIGPIPAVRSLTERNNVSTSDIDIVEFNEAFAGQVLACLDALGISEGIVSQDGGAISLGHPWGASGAVLIVRLFSRMVRPDPRGRPRPKLGLAMIASGGGQGLATLVAPLLPD